MYFFKINVIRGFLTVTVVAHFISHILITLITLVILIILIVLIILIIPIILTILTIHHDYPIRYQSSPPLGWQTGYQ